MDSIQTTIANTLLPSRLLFSTQLLLVAAKIHSLSALMLPFKH